MASFTDTQLPKFNPYVQQLPVEAMVAVGTQKQKAYEEGVQKIQAQIDNIAGLDVGRDVDKAYLQSKLNELGNNLRTVAAGDFSNFQLVNSVGGMTKQLVSDPYIKSAVSSTAHDRKEMALMEEDRKNGKLTPQAELFYGMKRQKYYNSSDLKDSNGSPIAFTGKYIQSWDLDKNILEAIKGVGDSKWTHDNVFKMVNGQIAKDSNGNPIYSEYATKAIREGKFSENVEAAIDGVLARPEAKQELTMRGVYNYRGYTNVDDFVKGYDAEKKKAITNLEAKKINIMEKVANSTNPEEKAQYQSLVNAIDSKIEETKQDAELKTSQALEFGSLEGYKAALETMKVKNSYMKSGVTETMHTEIIENIPYNKQVEAVERERKWKMDLDASKRGWANISIAEQNAAFEREKWQYDPKNPKNLLAPTSTILPLGNEFKTFYGELMDNANSAQSNLEATKFSVVSEYMAAINHGNGRALDKNAIEASIKKYEKDSPGFIDRMYGRAKKVGENPVLARNPLYSSLISTLPVADLAEAEMSKVNSTLENMNNSPEVKEAGGKEVDVAAIAKNYKPFEIDYVTDADSAFFADTKEWGVPKRTKKMVTAQDALDLAVISKNVGGLKGLWKSMTNSEVEQQHYESAQARIKNKFGADGQKLLRAMEGTAGFFGAFTGAPRKTFMPKEFQKVVGIAQSHKFDNVMAAKEKYLANNSLVAQPLAYSVYDVDMKGPERTSVDDRVKQVLNKYKSVGGLEEFNKLYSDPKNFSVQIAVDRGTPLNPGETFNFNLYDSNGMVKSVPISRQDAEYIKQVSIKLPPRPSEAAQRLETGKGTTNSIGMSPSNPEAYKGAMIPSTYYSKKLNSTKVLGADVVQSPTGGYYAYLYTKDPRTGNTVGVPVKHNNLDVYPAVFESVDAANNFLINGIDNKAFAESLIKNGF